jgi:hypothetical protein
MASIPANTFVFKISPNYRANRPTNWPNKKFQAISFTASTVDPQVAVRKTRRKAANHVPNPQLRAQLLGHFIE